MAHFFNLKGFLEEFKAFALKGNVIDLAVAVVIGGAFNKIVSVFVSSIITPIIGYLTSGVNLAYLVLKLGDVELKYGELLQATIDFLIIAFSVFVAIKLIGALRRKSEEAPAALLPSRMTSSFWNRSGTSCKTGGRQISSFERFMPVPCGTGMFFLFTCSAANGKVIA